jgi:hypothetical protein
MIVARPHEEARQQTLIEMHHPEFKHGYQNGRNAYFQTATPAFTDKQFVECLKGLVQDGLWTDDDEASDYFAIGYLIGQLSGAVIPRQPQECDEQERQQRLLATLRATYGDNEETERLVEAVSTMWKAQDYLALAMDVDTYERVLYRDASSTIKSL